MRRYPNPSDYDSQEDWDEACDEWAAENEREQEELADNGDPDEHYLETHPGMRGLVRNWLDR